MEPRRFSVQHPRLPAREIICPHCGEENPPKAYACIHCYKVIRVRPETSFWASAARPGFLVVGAAALLMIICGLALRAWLATVEAEMTINVKTAEYNVSLVADKKRRQATAASQGPSQPDLANLDE